MSFFNADIRVTGSDGLVLKDLGTNATTPGSGLGTLYLNSGQVYIRNSSGSDTSLSSGGGGGGSTAADDITVGDSSVNISTTSGNIIMHSVSNASNSIVMTSNSGASETIEIHNVQGTSSSSILLNSHSGGVKLEGKSTNKDNVSNLLEISSSQPTSNGSGFNPKYLSSFTNKAFGEIITTFQIDAENLTVASASTSDTKVIGTNNSTNAFFGRYNSSTMGNIYKVECFCVESPSPEISLPIEVGLAADVFGDPSVYNLSNGVSYSISSFGSGSGGSVQVSLTSGGHLTEIFTTNIGSGHADGDTITISGNNFETYYLVYVDTGSTQQFTLALTTSSSNPISTSYEVGSGGSGLTLNLKTLSDGGVNYIYGVSVASEGSGYSNGDLVIDSSTGSLDFGISDSGNSDTYGLGVNSSILSTSDSPTALTTKGNASTLIGVDLGITSNVSLISNNDYLYFVYHGLVSSNTTITGGKYLIKLYGTDF
jgi:hypothetical protein